MRISEWSADVCSSDLRLRFEVPPDRADPAEERLHRKQRLAATFRLFARYNLSSGIAGHVTVRDPELTDHFWVTPQGVHFSSEERRVGTELVSSCRFLWSPFH